jgi:hypothetical protein
MCVWLGSVSLLLLLPSITRLVIFRFSATVLILRVVVVEVVVPADTE